MSDRLRLASRLTQPRHIPRGARRAMMGISWMEFMVIAVITLIVIGPKDLLPTLRTLVRSFRAIRRMAGDFHSQIDEFVRDSGMDTVRRDFEDGR
jgi:sec-independent protein translocase protein TatB